MWECGGGLHFLLKIICPKVYVASAVKQTNKIHRSKSSCSQQQFEIPAPCAAALFQNTIVAILRRIGLKVLGRNAASGNAEWRRVALVKKGAASRASLHPFAAPLAQSVRAILQLEDLGPRGGFPADGAFVVRSEPIDRLRRRRRRRIADDDAAASFAHRGGHGGGGGGRCGNSRVHPMPAWDAMRWGDS